MVGGDSPEADGVLVTRVLGGDERAFAALYRAHARAVSGAVWETVRNPEVVADVVQEAFARALEHLSELRSPALFRPWLLTIARRVAIDQLRGQQREAELDDETIASLASTDRSPDETAELAELARLVDTCTATLSSRDAAVVSMVTHLGLRPREIADALGVTETNAKVIVHRARRKLRNALALRLMLKLPALACTSFRSLHDAGDLIAAARHLEDCESCIEAAGDEVQLYRASPSPSLP